VRLVAFSGRRPFQENQVTESAGRRILSAVRRQNPMSAYAGQRFLQGVFIPGIAAVIMAYISEEAPRQPWAARWRRM
jgi:hypothetical protein